MIPPIFLDATQQASFDREGFVVLPFISAVAIAELNALFDRLHPALPDNAFTSSSYSRDADYKAAVNSGIKEAFAPCFEGVFQNYTSLGGAFLYKTPGPKSELFPHQDWTIVDEANAVAINVWVPLTPIDEMNGTLHVLPGSHKIFRSLRSPTLPTMYAGHEPFLIENTVPLLIHPGEAVALNQALFHYSPSNRSDRPRIAITAAVKTRGASLRWHYRAPGSSEIEIWEQDDDFLNRFGDFFREMASRPTKGRLATTIPFEPAIMDRPAVEAAVARMQLDSGTETTFDSPLLADPDMDTGLTEEGYAVLDLLGSDEVAALTELFEREHPGDVKGFMATVHIQDVGVRRRVNEGIGTILRAPLARVMRDYRALGGSFIAKAAGYPESLRPHQDWSIVEEDRFRSFNVWIPLCDVDERNGAIRVLPGSHRWLKDVRGPNMPSPWAGVQTTLWEATRVLPMKAGQALVYDHRLIHASGPNNSAQTRVATVFGVTHRFAELRYHFLRDQQVETYRSHVRFMVEGDPPAGPGDLELLRTEPRSQALTSHEDLQGWLGLHQASH